MAITQKIAVAKIAVHIEFSTKRKATNFVLNIQLCLFPFKKSLIFINSKSFIKHANLC